MLATNPAIRTFTAMFAVVAAALVAAGCSSSDETDTTAAGATPAGSAPGLPAAKNPPATLDVESLGSPETVATRTGSGAAGTLHDPDVTIDPYTGTVYVAWAKDLPNPKDEDFGPQDLMVATSSDEGKTFEPPVRVNSTPGSLGAGFNAKPRIAVTGPNEAIATWPGSMSSAFKYMATRAARTTDGGKTWTKELAVAQADAGDPSDMYQGVAVAGKDVYVGFYDYREHKDPKMSQGISLVRSEDGGATFGGTTAADLTTCGCCANALAADADGTLYFAYRNADYVTSKTQIRDTAVIRSYDQGATWSEPVFMGQEMWRFNGCPEGGPELVVDGDGDLHGAYYTGAPGRPGVYYAGSTDGAKSFDRPVTLATDEFYPPANIDLAVDGSGDSWVVWDDRRTKESKVRVARVSGDAAEGAADPLDAGWEPAIDSVGGLTVIVWRTEDGIQLLRDGTFTPIKPTEHDTGDEHAAGDHHDD